VAQVRRPLIAALALFVGAIGFDRVGVAAGEEAVSTHAYLVAICFVALPLVVPAARRAAARTLAINAIGIAVGWSMLTGAGVFDGSGWHVALTEVVFVGLAAWLGSDLAAALGQLDEVITTTVSGESPALDLEGPVAANEIETEVARSRRHDRPMSVTVLGPTPEGLDAALDRAAIEFDQAMRARFVHGALARAVAGQLRRSDLLFEHRPSGRLIVLSPETDENGTSLLVRRITAAAERAGIDISTGTASFPDDGIGFEALFGHAERTLADSMHRPELRAVGDGGAA
jgi:hypothetical protein